MFTRNAAQPFNQISNNKQSCLNLPQTLFLCERVNCSVHSVLCTFYSALLSTEMGNSFPISNVTSSPLFLISLCMSNFVANEKRSIWDSKDIACKSCELT